MENNKSLKQLVDESGFTITHLAEKVLKCKPAHLSAALTGAGGKRLSPLREELLRDYLNKVAIAIA